MHRVALASLWTLLLPLYIPATQWLITSTNRWMTTDRPPFG